MTRHKESSMKITEDEVHQALTYQKPDEQQTNKFNILIGSFEELMQDILEVCPDCDDRENALRQLRDCRMWANSAIAHKGRY